MVTTVLMNNSIIPVSGLRSLLVFMPVLLAGCNIESSDTATERSLESDTEVTLLDSREVTFEIDGSLGLSEKPAGTNGEFLYPDPNNSSHVQAINPRSPRVRVRAQHSGGIKQLYLTSDYFTEGFLYSPLLVALCPETGCGRSSINGWVSNLYPGYFSGFSGSSYTMVLIMETTDGQYYQLDTLEYPEPDWNYASLSASVNPSNQNIVFDWPAFGGSDTYFVVRYNYEDFLELDYTYNTETDTYETIEESTILPEVWTTGSAGSFQVNNIYDPNTTHEYYILGLNNSERAGETVSIITPPLVRAESNYSVGLQQSWSVVDGEICGMFDDLLAGLPATASDVNRITFTLRGTEEEDGETVAGVSLSNLFGDSTCAQQNVDAISWQFPGHYSPTIEEGPWELIISVEDDFGGVSTASSTIDDSIIEGL